VDGAGIVFFTWGSPGGATQADDASPSPASAVCVVGDYPHEQQWRAEGFACRVSAGESELLRLEPPASLCAQIGACGGGVGGGRRSSGDDEERAIGSSRPDRSPDHADVAQSLRRDGSGSFSAARPGGVRCHRFVPLRVEVLVGGPSSPRGPRRYEWSRRRVSDDGTAPSSGGWTRARSFSPPGSVVPAPDHRRRQPITVAITGAHCAGKATIGRRVADALGWTFDPELGEVLRESVTAGGHRTGYGSREAWDERIYDEERKRDRSSRSSRVVETWHLGNLAWALWRRRLAGASGSAGVEDDEDDEAMVRKYTDSVRDHARNSAVLLVHLSTADGVSVRRRSGSADGADARRRLPMQSQDEECQCRELYRALETRGLDLVSRLKSDPPGGPCLPVLVIDNSIDGESAQVEVARSIVKFANENIWRSYHPYCGGVGA
jgi:hypothetical protein